MTVLEFWPDYVAGPLWTEDRRPADLLELGVERDLIERLTAWNAEYSEDKIPANGTGDEPWLLEGQRLLGQIPDAVGPQCRVIVTEPWWGEEPV